MKNSYEFKEYAFSYRFQGSNWAISVHAQSPQEAKEKIRAVANATYDGEVFATIPLNSKGLLHLLSGFAVNKWKKLIKHITKREW